MAATGVSVAGIDKRFGAVEVLHGVDLDVAPGSVLALLGPSGCGKTTLLRIVAGLERADAGTVRIGDRVVDDVPTDKRRVGLVFQDGVLFPHMDVQRNVGYGIGRREPDRDARIAAALELVGLAGYGPRDPGTLSGGQQQRVALARALAPRPSVLLLDEPFSNLDAALRISLRTEVHALLTELDVTSVFVTHDQDEAFVLGDAVAVMQEGRVVQVAAPATVYTRPATPWVASFVGDANLLPGDATGERVATALGAVPLAEPAAGAVQVLVRPESIALDAAAGGPATVVRSEYHGRDSLVIVLLPDGTELRARSTSTFAPGDLVTCTYAGPPTVAFPPA